MDLGVSFEWRTSIFWQLSTLRQANATPQEVAEFFVTQFPAPTQTWDILEGIRHTWPRHLLVKAYSIPTTPGAPSGSELTR